MLDSYYRKSFQKLAVDPAVSLLLDTQVKPNSVSVLSILMGICYLPLMASHEPFLALAFLVISGYLDVLDGSLARAKGLSSEQGAALDICGDRLVEFTTVLGLFLYDPARAQLTLLLLGSFYLCVTTFLVTGIFEKNTSQKSFHYSPGLIERTETFIYFAVVTLFPALFAPVTIVFALLVYLTAAKRFFERRKINHRAL